MQSSGAPHLGRLRDEHNPSSRRASQPLTMQRVAPTEGARPEQERKRHPGKPERYRVGSHRGEWHWDTVGRMYQPRHMLRWRPPPRVGWIQRQDVDEKKGRRKAEAVRCLCPSECIRGAVDARAKEQIRPPRVPEAARWSEGQGAARGLHRPRLSLATASADSGATGDRSPAALADHRCQRLRGSGRRRPPLQSARAEPSSLHNGL